MPFPFNLNTSVKQTSQEYLAQIMAVANKDYRPYKASYLNTQFKAIQELKYQAMVELVNRNYDAATALCELALSKANELNNNWITAAHNGLFYPADKIYFNHCDLSKWLIEELQMICSQAKQQKSVYGPIDVAFAWEHSALIKEIQRLKFEAMDMIAAGNVTAAIAKYDLTLSHHIRKLKAVEQKRVKDVTWGGSCAYHYALSEYLHDEIIELKNNALLQQQEQKQQDKYTAKWQQVRQEINAKELLSRTQANRENLDSDLQVIRKAYDTYKSYQQFCNQDDLDIFKQLEVRKEEMSKQLEQLKFITKMAQQKQQDNQLQKTIHDNIYMATQVLDGGGVAEALDWLTEARNLACKIQNPNNIESQPHTPVEDFHIAITELEHILKNDYEHARNLFASIYASKIFNHAIKAAETQQRGATKLYSAHKIDLETTIKNCITKYWKKFYGRLTPQYFEQTLINIVSGAIKDIGYTKWSADLLYLMRSNASIHNAEFVMQQIEGAFIEYTPKEKAPVIKLALLEPYRRELNTIPVGNYVVPGLTV